MLELTEILNNPVPINNRELVNIAALLSSDEAFIYTPTYMTDSQKELKKFKENTIELNKVLLRYSDLLKEKLSSIIKDKDLIWVFKLQANNAAEVVSDDISLIAIRDNYEKQLLKLLTSSCVTSFVLSLHFKYSRNELVDLDYNASFDFYIHHSFKVNNKREIRKSIIQFVKIVNLHLHAE